MSETEELALKQKKRNRWLIACTVIFVACGVAWLLYWLFIYRFEVSTNDSYVSGNQVLLRPQVAGSVAAIFADNTDLVEEGQVVVLLDKTDYRIAVNEKSESLARIVRETSQWFEDVKQKEAQVIAKRAEMIQAQLNLSHRLHLVEAGAVSQEDFEEHETSVAVSKAYYELALRDLDRSRAIVEGTTVETHPHVLLAVKELKLAYLNLIRCAVIAPTRGYVAKRMAQLGEWVNPIDTLLTIVPVDFMWLDANYKEVQLTKIRIGQCATFTADIYGSEVVYHGRVLGFSAGTGNAFALIPAQNASGNWIKIVQRLPVRISIDAQELKDHPLFIGLSTEITVDVHDTDGPMLCPTPQINPVYTTLIYDKQNRELEELNTTIASIIEKNKFSGLCGNDSSQ